MQVASISNTGVKLILVKRIPFCESLLVPSLYRNSIKKYYNYSAFPLNHHCKPFFNIFREKIRLSNYATTNKTKKNVEIFHYE